MRPIDVHDDDQCARAHEIVIAASLFERPHASEPSLHEHVLEWRHEDPAERHELWGAWRADDLVGVGSIWLPMTDNTAMAWPYVYVEPQLRWQGIGSELMNRLTERAREERRSLLVLETAYPADRADDHPYRRFLEKHGFTVANVETARALALPVDEQLLDELEEEARTRYAGRYLIETYVDGVPERLQESLCDVMNLLGVDAPTGEIDFEPESMTPERYRDYLDLEGRQGRTRLTTVALEEASGLVVAFTDLILPSGSKTQVWQCGTMVDRAHRGHRLGIAIKVANLRRLQQDHPERQEVQTGNADTNKWMVEINERLGFKVLELCPSFRRSLDPGSEPENSALSG